MGNPMRYIVEGANFVATIVLNTEHFDDPKMEAATRALENIFRHGPDSEDSDSFGLMCKKGETPAVGFILVVWEDGYIGDESKKRTLNANTVAKNAGLLELVRFYESVGMP